MSTELAMNYGKKYEEVYAKLLKKWQLKLEDVDKLSSSMEILFKEDLEDALAESLNDSLMSEAELQRWIDADVTLPSHQTLKNYTKIALKYALVLASADLIRRYFKSVKMNKENPPDISGAIRFYRPSEIISRAAQTVAQIYDMAKDWFSGILNRRLEKTEELTGRKRWVTIGDNSRHASLHHEVRSEDGTFTYKKKQILGPRPVGGNPYEWSGCSCRLQAQKKNGKWIDV